MQKNGRTRKTLGKRTRKQNRRKNHKTRSSRRIRGGMNRPKPSDALILELTRDGSNLKIIIMKEYVWSRGLGGGDKYWLYDATNITGIQISTNPTKNKKQNDSQPNNSQPNNSQSNNSYYAVDDLHPMQSLYSICANYGVDNDMFNIIFARDAEHSFAKMKEKSSLWQTHNKGALLLYNQIPNILTVTANVDKEPKFVKDATVYDGVDTGKSKFVKIDNHDFGIASSNDRQYEQDNTKNGYIEV